MLKKKHIYKTSNPEGSEVIDIIRVGDLVYLRGQCHNDGILTSPLAEQAEGAYKKIAVLLSQLGAEMSSIVDETLFVTNIEEFISNYDAFQEARIRVYGETPKAIFTIVEVKNLLFSGMLSGGIKVLIKCTAYLGGTAEVHETIASSPLEWAKMKVEQKNDIMRKRVISLGLATEYDVNSVISNMSAEEFKRVAGDLWPISRIHFRD